MKSLHRKTAILVTIFIISILVIGCSRVSPEESKIESVDSVKQKVIAHLTTKGYKEEEYKLNVEYHKESIGKYGGPYGISVIFNDEQNVIYYYRYNYNSELKDIKQISIAPIKDKGKDKNFKHYEE